MHSSNKALIIGTGFGSLYKSIYEGMGWEVTTIDIADPKSDYKTVVGSLVNDRYDKTELKNVRIKIDVEYQMGYMSYYNSKLYTL
jgi:hypothetical protein